MHFRKGRTPRTSSTFNIGNEQLQIVEQYKYLGVIFSEKPKYTAAADAFAKAGGRAIGAAISKVHSYKEIGFKTFETVFNFCISPVLDYCSGVWGYNTYHGIDMIQNRAVRYFCGLHRFAPTIALKSELGWLPST